MDRKNGSDVVDRCLLFRGRGFEERDLQFATPVHPHIEEIAEGWNSDDNRKHPKGTRRTVDRHEIQ